MLTISEVNENGIDNNAASSQRIEVNTKRLSSKVTQPTLCFPTKFVEDAEEIKPRRISPQNIVIRLRHRETYCTRQWISQFHVTRYFHQNVMPNFTVVNIDKPPCFLRKFTPDGKYLLAFSSDQTSIEVYEYRGPSAAEDLLANISSEEKYTKNNNIEENVYIKNRIFQAFFRLKHTISVTTNGEQLNRECSLFTDDSRYVIVGSAAYISEESNLVYFDIYRNNESVSLNSRSPLEDYSLHLIDIVNGEGS